ncbi:hypothetical protein C8J56DRAFT_897066 [Mycena floridula]|nr:hypothetical protein C8J56DRAFT_897066 [Mycena floridula]
MSASHESSIASSRQASPRAEVPSVPQEPINPEIAVLPVAPSSPVASSSPDANEPVPEPDELEGDEETPVKAKKGGKPSLSPAPRSPVDEAQQEPSPWPKSPSPASPRGSPKLTLPVMPASNAPSEHQPSASPHKLFTHLFLSLQALTLVRKAPASPKMPVPSTRPDPCFRIHSVRHAVYRELIEDPEPCHPLSLSKMNLLQLGADDLNYWGYVIDVMYRQLFAPLNPVKQVALITTITAMFMSILACSCS